MSNPQVTQLLASLRSGDASAQDELASLVYDTLRRLSARHIRNENHLTLQATELVHEAYLNLVSVEVEWQDRAHFYAVASRLMRRLLIDRARARLRHKRGGQVQQTVLEPDQLASEPEIQALELDRILEKLEALDKRKSDCFELHFFGGMTYPEIAEALSISEATVDRDLRFARAWVRNELEGCSASPDTN